MDGDSNFETKRSHPSDTALRDKERFGDGGRGRGVFVHRNFSPTSEFHLLRLGLVVPVHAYDER